MQKKKQPFENSTDFLFSPIVRVIKCTENSNYCLGRVGDSNRDYTVNISNYIDNMYLLTRISNEAELLQCEYPSVIRTPFS